jgi:hypothetical protein
MWPETTGRRNIGPAQRGKASGMTIGLVIHFPGHHLQRDAKGRRAGAELAVVQWRSSRPVTVFLGAMAAKKAVWMARA